MAIASYVRFHVLPDGVHVRYQVLPGQPPKPVHTMILRLQGYGTHSFALANVVNKFVVFAPQLRNYHYAEGVELAYRVGSSGKILGNRALTLTADAKYNLAAPLAPVLKGLDAWKGDDNCARPIMAAVSNKLSREALAKLVSRLPAECRKLRLRIGPLFDTTEGARATQ
jgi:hypothetical protein